MSFDPRVPKHLQLYIRRFHRNQALISKLEAHVVDFIADLEAMLAQLPQAGEAQPIIGLLDEMPSDEMEF